MFKYYKRKDRNFCDEFLIFNKDGDDIYHFSTLEIFDDKTFTLCNGKMVKGEFLDNFDHLENWFEIDCNDVRLLHIQNNVNDLLSVVMQITENDNDYIKKE